MMVAVSSIVVLVGMMGGAGFSLSVPPLPETPTLAKIAPEQCLFYLASAGAAAPDSKSENQVEQLLAEPEVQKLSAALETMLKAQVSKSMGSTGPLPGMSNADMADFIKLVVAKPMAVYISGVEMGPGGPSPRGGLAIKLDEDVERVKAKLTELSKLLPPPMMGTTKINGEDWQTIQPAPQVTIVWGFQKKYFLAAVGEGEMEALIARPRGEMPTWLVKLHKDVPIQRVSTVGYLNVKMIREQFGPMAGPQGAVAIEALGLNNVNALVAAAGLDETGYVAKTLVSLDGEPQGLLKFSTIGPLAAADLAPIPADAGLALAVKINPLAAFDAWIEMIGKTDPKEKAKVLADLGQTEGQIGLKIREDVLKAFGDSLCLYGSMGSAGGPDAVVSLQVKDSAQAATTFAKLMQLAEAVLGAQAASNPNAPKLTKDSSSGKDIYTLPVQGPVPGMIAPSWCLNEKELVVSISPASLKAYLSRPADFKSLAASAEIAKALSGDAGPVTLFYCDVKGLFEKLYVMVPMLPMILQQQGITLALPALPPADSIARHLTPLISTVRRTPAGIEIAERTPLPGLGVSQSVPVAAALLLPAVQAAREAARQASGPTT